MSTFDGQRRQAEKLLHLQLRFLQPSNKKKKNPEQQLQQGCFLGTGPLVAVRWPACTEWIMSLRPCEAVPCPPERWGTRWGVGRSPRPCFEWTEQDEFICQQLKRQSERLPGSLVSQDALLLGHLGSTPV